MSQLLALFTAQRRLLAVIAVDVVCLVAHLQPRCLVIEILLYEHLFGAVPEGMGHFDIHADGARLLEEAIHHASVPAKQISPPLRRSWQEQ
jgi:hypothetical protein